MTFDVSGLWTMDNVMFRRCTTKSKSTINSGVTKIHDADAVGSPR